VGVRERWVSKKTFWYWARSLENRLGKGRFPVMKASERLVRSRCCSERVESLFVESVYHSVKMALYCCLKCFS